MYRIICMYHQPTLDNEPVQEGFSFSKRKASSNHVKLSKVKQSKVGLYFALIFCFLQGGLALRPGVSLSKVK